jgi:hypothetical protein
MPVAEGIESTGPDARKRTNGREILASVGCAILGFAVTAGLLHAAIGDPLKLHAAVRSEKLVMLKQWHGKIFSAAFGSSHIHNGFDPRVFDATLAGSPAATRSANLAIEAGAQTEQFVMAQQFVKQLVPPAQAGAPNQPCIVMLELSAGANFAPVFLVNPRVIDIYDWHTTSLLTHYAEPGMPTSQRAGRLSYAGMGMGMHYMNVGMLSDEIFAPPLDEEVLQGQTADDRRGQLTLGYHPSYMPALYQFARQIAKPPSITQGLLVDGNSEMVRQLDAVSAVPNVSYVYVVMPKLDIHGDGFDYPDHLTVAGAHGPLQVPIINLNRVDRFPEFYNPELWFDGAHVNATGAKLVTKVLAEQLQQWYAAHGGPAPCG